MTVTAAAENLADVVSRAHDRNEATLLLENGEPLARVVPLLPRVCRADELAAAWSSLPHLSPAEAEAFERDSAQITFPWRVLTLPPRR